jgi:hypothetical protein
MADDISLENLDDDISLEDTPEEKKKRPSDPGKQALAGLSDIATGIPAILGLAGAGIEAGWDTATTRTSVYRRSSCSFSC